MKNLAGESGMMLATCSVYYTFHLHQQTSETIIVNLVVI